MEKAKEGESEERKRGEREEGRRERSTENMIINIMGGSEGVNNELIYLLILDVLYVINTVINIVMDCNNFIIAFYPSYISTHPYLP